MDIILNDSQKMLFNEICDLSEARKGENDETIKSQMIWEILRKKQELMRSMRFTDYITFMAKAGILTV